MDDARIRKLTSEVLAALDGAEPGSAATPLEARLAVLEAEVADLKQRLGVAGESAPRSAALAVSVHPSFQVLNLGSTSSRCVLEPDKPCSESGQCKSLGH